MQHDVLRTADSVSATLDGRHGVAIKWSRNRLHFHPRVFRLAFQGFDGVSTQEVDAVLPRLFSEALAGLAEHDPLLLRVTLDADARLLSSLREQGFLDARGVHLVSIEVLDLLDYGSGLGVDAGAAIDMVSLAEATHILEEKALVKVWLEAYGRAARLDPVTAGALSEVELRDLFLVDEDLNTDVTVCAVEGERLVGVCPVYRTNEPLQMELGTVGVGDSELRRHQAVSLAMLRNAAERAAGRGVERFIAEVDADAPDTVYLFAELPSRVTESLVSLMYVPNWNPGLPL